MFDITALIDELKASYYTSVIMLLAELITIIIALRHRQKDSLWTAFLLYLVSDFIILLSDLSFIGFTSIPRQFRLNYLFYTNTLVAAIEFYTYFYFFNRLFADRRIRKVLISLGIFFAVLLIIYIAGSQSFFAGRVRYFTYALGAIEFILLVPFCLLYYKRLFANPSSRNILNSPSFWIITGIFFFSLFSIPSYLLYNLIRTRYWEFYNIFLTAFYYIPITINFIFLAKAFLCKKPLFV